MRRYFQRIIECAAIRDFKVNDKNRLLFLNRNYGTQPKINDKRNRPIHPYKNLHPWISLDKFCQSLIDNIIYNQDGVVALNKPYGISNSPQNIVQNSDWNTAVGIPNSVDYTLSEVLPDLSKKLGYSSLSIVKSPERNISGVAILADNEKRANAIQKSLAQAQCSKSYANTYWIVTTKLPKCDGGKLNLAITKKESPCQTYKQPVILTTWKNNEVKRGEVKKLDVQYRTISKSSQNLSSLIEIKCVTTKWHAIRVFASTVLLSPVLGDRIHGSRVKKVMGTYLNISPFVDAAREEPILEQAFLKKLNLTPDQSVIIPAHIHLREVLLPSFPFRNKDLKLVAPLPPGFQWTCDQLEFQIPNEKEELYPELLTAASQ